MGTKTISITDDAYMRFASLKKENESFSMIIERVTGKKKLKDFFGVLLKETADELESVIKGGRKEHRKMRELRMKKIGKELKK